MVVFMTEYLAAVDAAGRVERGCMRCTGWGRRRYGWWKVGEKGIFGCVFVDGGSNFAYCPRLLRSREVGHRVVNLGGTRSGKIA